MQYNSAVTLESDSCPGVKYTVRRISLARRMALVRQIRELAAKLEFTQAGKSLDDRIGSALLSAEIDELYLRWGAVRVEGLTIDGHEATPERLMADGPEDLCREIVAAIKLQCALGDDERKN